MLIDWFTVAAQIVNFLILVWLLKRFLYRPILDAIDSRERRIAKELADADAKKSAAQQERDEFQRKNDEFDQQRTTLLNAAREEAHAERQRLLDDARKAADDLLAQRQTALRNDARNLNQELSLRTQQEVFAIARKALSDLADANLEARMVETFIHRLRAMDAQALVVFGAALNLENPLEHAAHLPLSQRGIEGDFGARMKIKSPLAPPLQRGEDGFASSHGANEQSGLKSAAEPALITSAFDLPAPQRTAIQNALNEIFAADIRVRFETAPEKISGIELSAQGQKIAWSIADYLAALENGVNEIVKAKAQEKSQ